MSSLIADNSKTARMQQAPTQQMQLGISWQHSCMLVCCAQIVEVIREHRFYEKIFVVETRPAGERELTDRQRVCFSS